MDHTFLRFLQVSVLLGLAFAIGFAAYRAMARA